ncbi:MAG: amino acid permease [bacterium]|nr:amino acid permease [bacterium]
MQISDRTGVQNDAKLLKILGVTFGIAITVGGMIGLGILRTPGTVAAQLGSGWLVMAAWVVGGIYALFGVVQVAELATSIPKTGGPYIYAERAFGSYAGFAVGWMDWIGYPAGFALTAITIGEYFALLLPDLSPYVKVIALSVLLLLGILNWFGLKVGSKLQEVTSFLKALVFLLLIAACFLIGGANPSADLETRTAPITTLSPMATLGAMVLALQGVIFAYDGWYAAAYFSEENKEPSKSLPRAMIAGVLSVMAIYLLFNLALLYVLPLEKLGASTLAAADAATVIFGEYGSELITVLAIISLLSIMNCNLLTGPRVLFAMARDGSLFSKAASVNSGGTPVIGLAITIGSALPLILIGTFERLLAVSAFLFIGIYLSAFVSLIKLRWSEPNLARPFKAWGYPWTTLIVMVGSAAFLVGAVMNDSENSIYALGVIVLSYPLFLLVRRLSRIAAI